MKAQIISMDLMIAVLIVLIITSSLGVLLYQYQFYDEQQSKLRDLELRSEPALNVLLSSKGSPDNWNSLSGDCPDMSYLGFMGEPAVITEDKLKKFVNLDYTCVQNILGIPGYDFYFEARNESGNIISVDSYDIKSGLEPAAGSEAIFSSRKAFTDQDRFITITLGVWYE